MTRAAGVLMPISALPGPYGIGTLGKPSRQFIDFLKKAGQTYWQILPVGPTGFGDSPYQSFCSFAGNPYYIDLDDLKAMGLLRKSEYADLDWGKDETKTDYGLLYQNRFTVLKKAVRRLYKKYGKEVEDFTHKNASWLDDYALFMAEKDAYEGRSYQEWEEPLRIREEKTLRRETEKLAKEISFWKGVQYLFFDQMQKVRTYAHNAGIFLIGDIPIYVSPDSSDIWGRPDLFQLDENLHPKEVAGCPPDGFSADGQLWGNPLYNWKAMKKDDYAWWTERIAYQFSMVDVLRIDHFRGFESYYAIPYGDKTARNGRWKKGPGIKFFRKIEKKLGHMNIIAEDLGFLTPEVIKMVRDTGYPGMKVLEFAFDLRDTGSDYLPYKYDRNCVAYCGTHDNETVNGWMKSAPKDFVKAATEYMHLDRKEGYHWGFIRTAYESVADLAVIQCQDLLGLDNRARFNVPSTTGGNWVWRVREGELDDDLAKKMHHMCHLYGRLPHPADEPEININEE